MFLHLCKILHSLFSHAQSVSVWLLFPLPLGNYFDDVSTWFHIHVNVSLRFFPGVKIEKFHSTILICLVFRLTVGTRYNRRDEALLTVVLTTYALEQEKKFIPVNPIFTIKRRMNVSSFKCWIPKVYCLTKTGHFRHYDL